MLPLQINYWSNKNNRWLVSILGNIIFGKIEVTNEKYLFSRTRDSSLLHKYNIILFTRNIGLFSYSLRCPLLTNFTSKAYNIDPLNFGASPPNFLSTFCVLICFPCCHIIKRKSQRGKLPSCIRSGLLQFVLTDYVVIYFASSSCHYIKYIILSGITYNQLIV